MITAERYHDISCGHRVHGHESKCAHLHGHNYRITFVCEGEIDAVGRVLDFSAIKACLCMWLEHHWDHKFLAWDQDTSMRDLNRAVNSSLASDAVDMFHGSIVWVPFNPTAENMAKHLHHVVAPRQLEGTGVRVVSVRVEETRKCSATSHD